MLVSSDECFSSYTGERGGKGRACHASSLYTAKKNMLVVLTGRLILDCN